MITIGYSTRETKPEFYEYLKKSSGIHKVQVIEKVNNGDKSLSQVYNEIIEESNYDIIVLCHDDIYFDTNNWGKKLLKNFQNNDFGIIGVAGTTNIPVSGRWWEDMSKMSGIVNHEHEGRKWESKYSNSLINSLQEVCLIDGVFISLNKNKINNKFNESVKGFHFYDVYFSVENHLSGVKIGVTHDVRLTHKSIGQTNDKWEENRLEFTEKFTDSLPINFVPNINYEIIDAESKEKYQLLLQSTTTSNTINFINSLSSLKINNIDVTIISNGENTEDLNKLENVKVIEGYFDSIGKNLSVLKWDNDFINSLGNNLFLSIDNVILKNNVFSHLYKILKKDSNLFGCVFPTSLNNNLTIFSSGLLILMNSENKLAVSLINQNRYYELFHGNKKNYFGNISSLILTTKKNLTSADWMDINLETELTFTDFCFKLSKNNLNVFIDSNSIVQYNSDINIEKMNNELQNTISKNLQDDSFLKNIKRIK